MEDLKEFKEKIKYFANFFPFNSLITFWFLGNAQGGLKTKRLHIFIMCLILFSFMPPLVEAKTASEWINEGVDLAHLKRYEEANKAFDEALKINPQNADAWYNKGNVFYDLKRYDEAIKAYDKALKVDPQYPLAWNNKGNALDELKRYDEAIKAYDEELKINPQYRTWNNKGLALEKLGRYDEAKRAFDEAAKLEKASQENNWIIISGIAIFIIIGIIVLRNGKNKSNNESLKNTNTDYKINKWKIFGYVVITWFVFSFLAEIYVEIFLTDSIEAQGVIWALMAFLLSMVMVYRLNKIIELFYGFVIFFIIILTGVFGILVGLGYFGWSYTKLEKQKIEKEQLLHKDDSNIGIRNPFENQIEQVNNGDTTKPIGITKTENMTLIEELFFIFSLLISFLFIVIGSYLIFFSFFEIVFHWKDFLLDLLIALIASGIVMAVGSSIDKKFNNSVKAFLEDRNKALFDDKGLLRTFSLLLIILLPLLLYLLAFALYSALTFALYGFLLISNFPRVPVIVLIGLAIVAIGTGIAVLLGLYYLFFPPRRKAFGIEIKREEQKALWDITKEIATQINAKPINKIIITPDPGIGVYLEGNVFWTICGGGRRVLEIGLPSLHDLNVDEFKVIIAHEYGHFSNRDTQWSSFTYTMGNSLLSTLRSTPGPKQDEKEKGGIVGGIMYLNPAYWILLLYVILYFKVTNGFSRVREVMADIMAMKLYGGRVFSEGLHKVALNDLIFSEMVQAEYMTLSRNRKKMINNMSQLIEYAHERVDKFQVSWRLIAEIEKLKSGDFSQSESQDIYDSHPSLKVRIDYAKKFDSLEAKDNRPVDTLFNDWDNINEKLAELFNLRLSIYDRALMEPL